MTDFEVVLVDGPAQGFRYETLVEPDRVIFVTDLCRPDEPSRWTRVLEGWDGAERYGRQAYLPAGVTADPGVLLYRHQPVEHHARSGRPMDATQWLAEAHFMSAQIEAAYRARKIHDAAGVEFAAATAGRGAIIAAVLYDPNHRCPWWAGLPLIGRLHRCPLWPVDIGA